MKNRWLVASLCLIYISILSSCNKEREEVGNLQIEKLKLSFINQFEATYMDLTREAEILDDRVSLFYNSMNISHFDLSKSKWKEVNRQINYLGPFRYSGGIDGYYNILLRSEFASYPINMEFVDYTFNDPNAGMIQDPVGYPDMTGQGLHAYNQQGTENNLSLGMHVMEFLLWGEDQSTTGPGGRMTTDFSIGPNAFRRRTCLLHLSKEFKSLVQNTGPTTGYKSWFMKLSNNESLYHMFSGIYRYIKYDFAEKSIKASLEGGEVYEESRFSDNSLQDLKDKLHVLKTLLTKEHFFAESSQYSFYEFFEETDESVNSNIQALMYNIELRLLSIDQPFDLAISNPVHIQSLNHIYEDLLELAIQLKEITSKYGVNSLE